MAKQVDLLNGSILRSLTVLALPIMGSQLVQMAYNLTDMLWIGRISANAVAAVGAAGMFMWLSNGLAVLARIGGQVTVAQSIGAGDMPKAGRYGAAALQLSGTLAAVYTLAMIFGAAPLIGFFKLNSPQVEADARAYLIIVSAGMVFSFVNQVLVAIINATGNSRTPFLAMGGGLGINILLDPLLIFGVGPLPQWGVAGAAVATVLAQGVVFALLVRFAMQDQTLFCWVKLTRPATRQELKSIVRISGPAAAMNVFFPLIGMVIARLVAHWGDSAVAVQKVGSQIESISWMTADGFAAALNSFVAQNYGAGNLDRAKRGVWTAFGLMTLWGILCSALLIFFAEPIFRVFIPDAQVLPMGADYLIILGYSELFMCWEILIEGAYAGFGNTLPASAVGTVFTGLRIPAAILLSATALGLSGVWWSISVSSIFKGVILTVMFLFFVRRLSAAAKGDKKA